MDNEKQFHHYQAFLTFRNMDIDSLLAKTRQKQNKQVHLQLLDPTLIVSRKQIEIAIYHALKAFDQNRNIARDQATEFLIRIAAKKQISSALELFGIKENSDYILVISFGGSPDENREEIEHFLKQTNIPQENVVDFQFPHLSVRELSQKYNCEEDIAIIEKKVLENMALTSI